MQTVIKVARQLHKGKNLINWNKYLINDYGLTCEIQTDKRVRVYGTPTEEYAKVLNTLINNILLDGKTYTISSGIVSSLLYVQVRERNKVTGESIYYYNRSVYSVSFTANLRENDYLIMIQTANVLVNFDLIISPQLEEGTTPTPYEPYKNNYLPRHLLNRRSVIFE